jgi:glycosyltransferase involved in cell wall biosynthesis
VINNGVLIPDNTEHQNFRARIGVSRQAMLLAMLANLTRYKDHETLLRAFAAALMQSGEIDFHLVLAGQHEDSALSIKALAWDLGLSGRLHLPGSLRDCSDLLSAADFVVHSSRLEGCPNGVLEAMAYGKCVLGTNIPGMRQALGERYANLCLAEPGDSHRLAELILSFAADKQQREVVGRENQQRIRNEFAIQGMAVECLRVISNGSIR